MAKIRLGLRLVSALALVGGAQAALAANPSADDLLKLRPKQDNIAITTPTEAEIAACKVEVIKGDNGSGYLLRDATGRPVRRFYDSNGDRYIDVWSYYLDGNEVYREIDSNFNKKVDQFRWFSQGGMKVGVDLDEDGKIDRWDMISPEEVSQEILQAVISRDITKLQALMISDADIKTLELPAGETTRIKEKMAKSVEKFNQTSAALIKLSAKTKWIHLETAAPQCVPSDAIGSNKDLIRYKSGTILYENEGKHDFLQTGEMILVGRSWKIIDAPTMGYAAPEETGKRENDVVLDEKTKDLVLKLQKVDETAPRGAADPVGVAQYNLARAGVLEQLAAATKGSDQGNWIKQLADCLSAAAQNSPANDKSAFQRLVALRESVAKNNNTKLAGYVAYREISADYASKLSSGKKLAEVQEEWREKLKDFVSTYPSADDAPEALLQLGMVSEFVGKETEARNWYDRLGREYTASPLSAKAKGAVRRLDSEGKPLELSGPMLANNSQFDIRSLQGKVVIVYYWASWNAQTVNDFARLKGLKTSFGSKGLELVLVNLDANQGDAVSFLQRNPLDGSHLFQPGALDSPYAVNHGVMVLPNMFLVGKDGKVISRSIQVNGLDDEIKKLMN